MTQKPKRNPFEEFIENELNIPPVNTIQWQSDYEYDMDKTEIQSIAKDVLELFLDKRGFPKNPLDAFNSSSDRIIVDGIKSAMEKRGMTPAQINDFMFYITVFIFAQDLYFASDDDDDDEPPVEVPRFGGFDPF